MTPYVVLARKWRPRSFATLVGQEHVTRALSNALTSGRIPHAFLFTGIRGVGKTTLARLLAMCLNCRKGVTPEPCGTCDACQGVIGGNLPDVMEIDAASRTKVDQMREVLDTVRYTPVSSRFKVYILDEVHMLTTQSFNALLKTLEEPPSHVKFIFATTEARKIPPTILSRCQRHDLRRIGRDELAAHLTTILEAEQISGEPAALDEVARAADGSVRDALSLLDQVIAHGNGAVRYEEVSRLLGLTDREAVLDLLERILASDPAGMLAVLERFHQGGVEPAVLVNDLLGEIHGAARRKVLGEGSPVGAGPGPEERLARMTAPITQEQLQMVYQILLRGVQDVRQAEHPTQALEMLLLRVVFLKPVPGLEQLIRAVRGGSAPVAPNPVLASPAGPVAPPVAPFVAPARPENGPDSPPVKGFQGLPKPASRAAPPPPVASISMESQDKNISNAPLLWEHLPSWPQLVYCAMRNASGLGIKLRQQVACLEYQPGTDGHPLHATLRLVNDCFGPPQKVATRVTEFLESQGLHGARVTVLSAASTRPETLQEQADRESHDHYVSLEQASAHHPALVSLKERFQAELLYVEEEMATESGADRETAWPQGVSR